MKPECDKRNIVTGHEIPKESYCDQPYVVIRKDGAWVVCLTTGKGSEGAAGQHVISSISFDKGKTWQTPVDIEPACLPEASWVMPFITDHGRIYAFYVYNKDDLRRVHCNSKEGYTERVDTLGYMAYKYSDDGGESWSEKRYYIPIRNFDIDDENPYGGKIQYFWGVGKPISHKGAMIFGFSKVGLFGEGFMEKDEGAFIRCANINTEKDPEKLVFETLPEGKTGLRAPYGKISDEHNLVSLNDGGLFCTFRTVTGHNCMAYSRDDGKTWSDPEYAKFSPGGKPFKHPRAANFVHKYSNGKYTLWFHNHGKDMTKKPGWAYTGRNPAFMCGGVEHDGHIYWSQPEVVLYSRNVSERISYPDFIEDGGKYYITETQKTVARVHEIDKSLFETMWNSENISTLCTENLLWETKDLSENSPEIPKSISVCAGDSFTVQLILDAANALPGIILDGRNAYGAGILLEYTDCKTVRLTLCDGERINAWESDGITADTAHITATVDSCAGIISFMINGQFCDGNESRDYGFGRIDLFMNDIAGKGFFSYGPCASHCELLRFYDNYLLNNLAAGNYRYDMNIHKEK